MLLKLKTTFLNVEYDEVAIVLLKTLSLVTATFYSRKGEFYIHATSQSNTGWHYDMNYLCSILLTE